MYLNMADAGARLDPQAAASMISLYRQNNGLGAVVVDPDLMKLAEAQSQAMASRNKLDHDVKAPLPQAPQCRRIPGDAGGRECVGRLPYAGGSVFRLARTRRRTGPIC